MRRICWLISFAIECFCRQLMCRQFCETSSSRRRMWWSDTCRRRGSLFVLWLHSQSSHVATTRYLQGLVQVSTTSAFTETCGNGSAVTQSGAAEWHARTVAFNCSVRCSVFITYRNVSACTEHEKSSLQLLVIVQSGAGGRGGGPLPQPCPSVPARFVQIPWVL